MDIVITTKKKIDEEYRKQNAERSIKEHQTILENDRLRREIIRLKEMCPIIRDAYEEPLGCKSLIYYSTEYCRYCKFKPYSDVCGENMDKNDAIYFYKDEHS